eukprot:4568647-Prymnesium_polylepis.1
MGAYGMDAAVSTFMTCYGTRAGAPCPSRVHGVRCAQITKGFVSLGVFLCPDCRLASQVRPSDE